MSLSSLDCSGCKKCCEGDVIVLDPARGDDARLWRTESIAPGVEVLARDAAGNCVYLGDQGCTIHDQPRPFACGNFDCRAYYLMLEPRPADLVVRLADPRKRPAIEEGRRRIYDLRRTAQP